MRRPTSYDWDAPRNRPDVSRVRGNALVVRRLPVAEGAANTTCVIHKKFASIYMKPIKFDVVHLEVGMRFSEDQDALVCRRQGEVLRIEL